MVIVTFREPHEKLTCMFTKPNKSVAAAKQLISDDAAHFAKLHSLKNWKLVNVSPQMEDYFKLVDGRGREKLIYQYFMV